MWKWRNVEKINHHYNSRSIFLTGIDANPNIVALAQRHTGNVSNIQLICENILTESFYQKKFDVVLATLFLHHFTNDQLVNIFKRLKQQARIGIVVNDLHRHALAYYSIMWITRLFSKSEMVKIDAPLSVLRGFTRSEIISILNQAEITNYTLRWKWAFRWQLIIRV